MAIILTKPIILVIDNEEIIRNFINELLYVDYEVLLAVDGNEAISLFKRYSEQIVMVITDVHIQCVIRAYLMEWQQKRKREQLPMLILGCDICGAKVSNLVHGAKIVWLPKPFNAGEFQATVRRMLLTSSKVKSVKKSKNKEVKYRNSYLNSCSE